MLTSRPGMRVRLEYGREGLNIEVPSQNVDVITPSFVEALPDEAAAFREAARRPIESAPLADLIGQRDRVAVVIPDITRPMPTGRLLGWLFEELSHVANERITIISGTGSHRANTESELISMLGEPIVARYRIVNHSAHDPATLAHAGTASDGRAISLCRQYVEADRRIVLGFIEPHFMAGFSGGYKGVFPALADIDSIMHYHRAAVIGDPKSTWGNLEDNPTQAIVRQYGSVLPVDFLINVTQNKQRGITGFFCGEPLAAHRAGAAFAKTTAMAACARSYPIVVTSNAGYPLDQNLYQTVKGMSAAAQIVEPSGYILTASECCDGFPAHGNFKRLLFDHQSPSHVLDTILSPGFSLFDQWEAQILAMIAQKAHLGLYSSLAPAEVRRAYIEPIHDITERLSEELGRRGSEAPIAVLPEGPMTIPYLGNA